MPAVQQEYDYYEYARRKQGAVKNAAPNFATSKTTNRTINRRNNYNNNTTSNSTKNKNANPNVRTSATREVTKNATRIATSDDFIGTKRKSTTSKKSNSKINLSEQVIITNKKKNKVYQKPQEMTLKKPKVSKSIAKKKAEVKAVFNNIVVTLFVFGMLFLICYRYSYINESFNELNDIKTELKNKQTVNAQIESSIQKSTDLAYIENYAKYQLGMQKPKESQVRKISVKKQDKITTPIEIKEEESTFKTIINNLMEILN